MRAAASSSRCSAARRRRGRSRRARSRRGSCRPSGSWARPRLRLEPMDRRFCAAAARTRLDRGSHHRDRVSLGGGTQRALRRDRGRVRPAQGRCHRHGGNRSRPGGKAGDISHPDRLRGRRGTRSASVSSRAWRDRAATSPACRARRPILPASGSNFCARLSPVSAGWRSWPMSVIPTPCWRCARSRQRPARSASKSPHQKSGEPRISRPPSRRSRAARTHFMSVAIRSYVANRIRISTLALGARLPTMHGSREYVEAGGLMSYGPNSRTCSGAPPICRQNSARGEAGEHPGRAADQVRSRHQPDDREGAWPRRFRRSCSPAPTR